MPDDYNPQLAALHLAAIASEAFRVGFENLVRVLAHSPDVAVPVIEMMITHVEPFKTQLDLFKEARAAMSARKGS